MLIVEFRTDMLLGKHALERAPGMVIRNGEEYIHAGGAERPDPTPPTVAATSLADVRAGLHHVHLPKLDDAAVVEFAPEEGSVRTGAAFPLALDLLRTVGD